MINKLESDLLKVKFKKLIQVEKQEIIKRVRNGMINQYGNRIFCNQPVSYKQLSEQMREEVIRDRMYTPYLQNSRLNNSKITNLNNSFPKSQERARSCSDKDFILMKEKTMPVYLPERTYFNRPEIIPDYYRRPLVIQYRELNKLRKKPDTALHGSKLDVEEVLAHQYNDVNKKINTMFRSQLQTQEKQRNAGVDQRFMESQGDSTDRSPYKSLDISQDVQNQGSNIVNSMTLSQ